MNNNENLEKKSVPQPEQRLKNKEIIDGMIESLILHHSSYVNEGNNGIIKKVNIDELPEIVKEPLRKHCPDIFRDRSQMAIKMLKIYTGGKGKNEFILQKKSHAILADKPNDDLAEIPEPLLYHEVEIKNEETKEKLRREGLKIEGDKIEILLMDFIEGEDLAENLYREVVKRHPDLSFLQNDIDQLKISDLHSYVSSYLGFSRPGGKHHNEGLINFEKEIVQNQNAEKIIKFLKTKGYALDPAILTKIKNTLELLHANNIYHRDLHERNIMLTFNGGGGLQNVTLVDFGSAILVEDNASVQDIYKMQTDKKLVSDEMILHRYEPLAKSPREETNENLENYKKEMISLSSRLRKKPEWRKMLQLLKKADNYNDALKNTDLLISQISGPNNDLGWQVKAAAILELAGENRNLARIYYELIKTNQLSGTTPFVKQVFDKLEKII